MGGWRWAGLGWVLGQSWAAGRLLDGAGLELGWAGLG